MSRGPLRPTDTGQQIVGFPQYHGLPVQVGGDTAQPLRPRITGGEETSLLVRQGDLVLGGPGDQPFVPRSRGVQLVPRGLEPLPQVVEPGLRLVVLQPRELELLVQVAGQSGREPGTRAGFQSIQVLAEFGQLGGEVLALGVQPVQQPL